MFSWGHGCHCMLVLLQLLLVIVVVVACWSLVLDLRLHQGWTQGRRDRYTGCQNNGVHLCLLVLLLRWILPASCWETTKQVLKALRNFRFHHSVLRIPPQHFHCILKTRQDSMHLGLQSVQIWAHRQWRHVLLASDQKCIRRLSMVTSLWWHRHQTLYRCLSMFFMPLPFLDPSRHLCAYRSQRELVHTI